MKLNLGIAGSLLSLILILAALIGGQPAGAQVQAADAAVPSAPWTTVASAGTVDEADQEIVEYTNAFARIKPFVQAGDLTIRYNVVAVNGLMKGHKITMTARYHDNGDKAQVIVRLCRVLGHDVGAPPHPTCLLTIDSGLLGGSGWESRTASDCFAQDFAFERAGYWVEVQLIRKASAVGLGDPMLSSVRIATAAC